MPNPFVINRWDSRRDTLPYIIAEIGVNHECAIDRAKTLIDEAKKGGAHAVKFQSYKAETLAAKNSPSYWDLSKEPTMSQYELFKRYDRFGEEDYRHLHAYCEAVGIDFLSTPFDLDAVDFLAPLVPCFKIASADLTNIPLLKKVVSYGKPIILSTGASTIEEITQAVDVIGQTTPLALLHCVLAYPTPYADANLAMITGLKTRFPNYVVGYSDHTPPDKAMHTLVTAYTLGARIIEKHFTNDKTLPGNDHYHAMDWQDLKKAIRSIRFVRDLLGCAEKKSASE